MTYVAIVYYSWLVALALWGVCAISRRRRRGLVLIVSAALIQVAAHLFHLSESSRLAGQPDALYSWIAPLAIALIGCGLWLAGLFRQNFTSRL